MSDPQPFDWAAFARSDLGLNDADADALGRAGALVARLPDADHATCRARRVLSALAGWSLQPLVLLSALLCPIIRGGVAVRGGRPAFNGAAITRAELAAAWLAPTVGSGEQTPVERGSVSRAASEPRTPRQVRADRLRRLFWLAYHDWEAVLIVVADHLAWGAELEDAAAGSSTLDTLRPWCEETDGVFLPLLEMLGMWDLRRTIGDRAFAIQQPAEYALGRAYEDRYRAHHADNFAAVAGELRIALDTQDTPCQIDLHVSDLLSVKRVQERAARRHERFTVESLLPTLRLNLVVDTEEACYSALGEIHRLWRPVSRLGPVATGGRFYDNIATPRFNGYRRLITTVLADDRRKGEALRLMEFSIFTGEMRAINEGGVAAAHAATAPAGAASAVAIRNVWWTNEEHAEVVQSCRFGETSPQTYVFSPLGEIYLLPAGGTPVDFAFGVHSQIGASAKTFWVNGAPARYDTPLRNGDLVEVEWDAHYSALVPGWEKAARTTTAKIHIRRALTQRDRSPNDGRARIDLVLRRELEICKLRLTSAEIDHALARVARSFKCPDPYSLYVKINEGTVSPDQVAARVVEDRLIGEVVQLDGVRWPGRIHIAQCWMSQEKTAGKLGSATRVYPGIPISGHEVRTRYHSTLVVHRADCPLAPPSDVAIPLRWRSLATNREAVEISIAAFDRPHLLRDLLDTVYGFYSKDDTGLYLHQSTAEVHNDGTATISLVVAAPTLEALQPLEARFEWLKQEGFVHAFQIWHYSPGQRQILAASENRRVRNPYSPHEVRSTSMFFGRQREIAQLVDHLRDGQKLTILFGHKRIGKTSLLYHLRDYALRGDPGLLPVFVDAQAIEPLTPSRLARALADAGTAVITEYFGGTATRGLRMRARDLRADPFDAFGHWANAARETLRGRTLVFMIDEFTRLEEASRTGKLSADFFPRLRALIGSLPDIQWLLCLHESLYSALVSGDARDGMWALLQEGEATRLSYLDAEAAKRLIREPMGRFYTYDDFVVQRILELTAGHPYYIHIICSGLASHMRDGTRTQVTAADLAAVTEQLSMRTSFYFTHFYEGLSRTHTAALNAIARASASAVDWLGIDVIAAGIRAQGLEARPDEVERVLAELGALGIVAWEDTWPGMRYRTAVGLYHAWLRKHPLIPSREARPTLETPVKTP